MVSAAQPTPPWPIAPRYERRRRAIGEGCESPNVHVAVVGDGHTHGLFVRTPANHRPSFNPCLQVHRHAASAHTFCPPCYASLCTSQALTQACVKMHAWWGRTQKLCTRVMRPASTSQYSILRPPLGITYAQLHAATRHKLC
ncbi:hypothetical protein GGI42DRAFT_44184 [Trichoderma sp. SZMC 28013]